MWEQSYAVGVSQSPLSWVYIARFGRAIESFGLDGLSQEKVWPAPSRVGVVPGDCCGKWCREAAGPRNLWFTGSSRAVGEGI